MYDDYDYPREPSEEELLAMAIEDDAELDAPFGGVLLRRQEQNWGDAQVGMLRRFAQLNKDFDDHQVSRVAQWWDLVSIWDIDARAMMLPDWEVELSEQREYDDIHSYTRLDPIRLTRSYEIRMDFKARTMGAEWWINGHFRASGRDRGLLMEKPGYRLVEPLLIRYPIRQWMQYTDDDRRQVKTTSGLNIGISVMAQHPPPVAGKLACWLPSLAGYQQGVE